MKKMGSALLIGSLGVGLIIGFGSTQMSITQRSTNQVSNGNKIEEESLENIDIDLTQMNGDMVYATVYQLMIDPKTYIGKTVKMTGTYYPVYYEPTKGYYHYCLIKDAMACCAQGMEFIWEDGTHIYPDEYPKVDTTITVTGTFETYHDQGDEKLYCRLKNAQLSIEK